MPPSYTATHTPKRGSAWKHAVYDLACSLVSFFLLFAPYHYYGERVWTYAMANFTPFQTFMLGILAANLVLFWSYAAFFAMIDLCNWPTWCARFKVQPEKSPDVKMYIHCIKQVLFIQATVNVPVVCFVWKIVQWQGRDIYSEPLPSVGQFMLLLIPYLIVEEIGMYYIHRLGHHRRLYKHIHKKHHEYTAPISIASIYAHPLEHLFVNLLPLFAGPLLMQTHALPMALWIHFGQLTAMTSHCGYALPGFPTPLSHEYHHQVFMSNFGILGILDWLHGTRGNFYEWEQKWLSGEITRNTRKEKEEASGTDEDQDSDTTMVTSAAGLKID